MFTDFFVRGGGQRADDPRFASKARDARFFGMSYSEKCPPSDLVREVGKMSVEGGAPPPIRGGAYIYVVLFLSSLRVDGTALSVLQILHPA